MTIGEVEILLIDATGASSVDQLAPDNIETPDFFIDPLATLVCATDNQCRSSRHTFGHRSRPLVRRKGRFKCDDVKEQGLIRSPLNTRSTRPGDGCGKPRLQC